MNWPDTPNGGRLGDGRFASATDRPETIDALRQVVLDRVAQGHALYPQGGCTALDHGGIPRLPGVAVDMTAFNRVIEYPVADMTITVEAGVSFASLRAVLAAENQRVLIDPPQPDRATLGGVYATNSCGPRRFGFGRPRDQIIGVGFVTSDGALVKGGGRVVKNVAGYDFPRLLTGSMGTLGVITFMTLKVRPLPEASALVWMPISTSETIAATLERLNTSATRPVAVELLNPPAATIIGASIGETSADWALVVGFEDNSASVAWQVDQLMNEQGRDNVVTREGADAGPLWAALSDFQARELGPLTIAASIPPSSVAAFVKALDSSRWAVQVHAGNGIVRAHRTSLDELEPIAAEIESLRVSVARVGGHVILTRCPTGWKERLRVWGHPRPDWALSERIKTALDPRGVMNPGRFVGTI